MNKELLLIISLFSAVMLLVACGGVSADADDAQLDTASSAQPVAVSQKSAALAELIPTEISNQAEEEDRPTSEVEQSTLEPQPVSIAGTETEQPNWGEDTSDVMRSGRTLQTSSVYAEPIAESDMIGELDYGELVIVTRALDDWYEIIFSDGATRHAWLPQTAITFEALPLQSATVETGTSVEITAADSEQAEQAVVAEVVEIAEQPLESAPVASVIKQAAPKSTQNGTIVFQTSSGGAIYTMNADGSTLQWVASGGLDPALSPDGTQIAYTRWDEPRGLYVVNIDGSNERWLVADNFVKNPTWSPDGEQIVYNLQKGGTDSVTFSHPRFGEFTRSGDDYWRLEIINVDGSVREGLDDQMISWNPDWSERGILFVGATALYVTDPDSEPYAIYEALNQIRNATWSPDSQSIIAMMEFHDHWEVVRLNIDGFGLTRLTKNYDRVNGVAPTWSPDGQSILYLSDRNDEWELWVMNADGSNQRLLAPDTLAEIDFHYDFNAEHVADWN